MFINKRNRRTNEMRLNLAVKVVAKYFCSVGFELACYKHYFTE